MDGEKFQLVLPTSYKKTTLNGRHNDIPVGTTIIIQEDNLEWTP